MDDMKLRCLDPDENARRHCFVWLRNIWEPFSARIAQVRWTQENIVDTSVYVLFSSNDNSGVRCCAYRECWRVSLTALSAQGQRKWMGADTYVYLPSLPPMPCWWLNLWSIFNELLRIRQQEPFVGGSLTRRNSPIRMTRWLDDTTQFRSTTLNTRNWHHLWIWMHTVHWYARYWSLLVCTYVCIYLHDHIYVCDVPYYYIVHAYGT